MARKMKIKTTIPVGGCPSANGMAYSADYAPGEFVRRVDQEVSAVSARCLTKFRPNEWGGGKPFHVKPNLSRFR